MGDLKASFTAFASYGAGGKEVAEMESKNFFKCIKDSGLIDKALTQTDCDLIFTKVKTKGARKINFAEFCAALEHVAAKKKVSVDEVKNIISSSSAKTTGTIAEAVKYHDDKSLYSGVYANGGPTNVDREKQGLQRAGEVLPACWHARPAFTAEQQQQEREKATKVAAVGHEEQKGPELAIKT